MNYTRKRALLACDFCRHRKRRCDGKKPCSTCKDSNADCVYKELPSDRVEDASPSAVIDRLARIETLLEQQSHQIYQLNTRSSPGSYPPSQTDYLTEHSQQYDHIPSTVVEIDPGSDSPQFLIPRNHATLVTTLLSMPPVRDLLGEYPYDFFYQIEENLPLPEHLSSIFDSPLIWPHLDPVILDKLAESYFRNCHPHHPLFTRSALKAWQTELLGARQLDNIDTSICFTVYALGAICASQEGNRKRNDICGIEYFQPAFKIMVRDLVWSFRPNINTCLALSLAASYFSHLGRPLQSWRMTQFASRMFLTLVDRNGPLMQTDFEDMEVRIFWQCFMVECDRVADLDVPRSGIEPLGDKMPLPHSTEPRDNENHIYYIAEHAIRRLLNRIHNALYGTESGHASSYQTVIPDPTFLWKGLSIQKLLSLSSELNRQLEEWYNSIPEYLRPPKGTDPLPNDRARVLRLRYYTARQLIHRPFLLLTVSRQQEYRSPSHSPMPSSDPFMVPVPVVLEKCQVAITSCVAYLYNATEMINKRSPYLWMFSQGCLACFVMLWLAENSVTLRSSVPAMQHIKGVVTANLRQWAIKNSSFEAEIHILEQLVFSDHMDT
ncbi:hypothetical protein F4775DRAFT_596626 [Biscogniauxia sp. FL1348]|nr:hypothetical protein F4775DRAFT_596626 [Biscogniauxia sp. FL1348]